MSQERVEESVDFEPFYDAVEDEETPYRLVWANSNLSKLQTVSEENMKCWADPLEKNQLLSLKSMCEAPTSDGDTDPSLAFRAVKKFLENTSTRGSVIEHSGPVTRKKSSEECEESVTVVQSLVDDMLSQLENEKLRSSELEEEDLWSRSSELENSNAIREVINQIIESLPPLHSPEHPQTETSEEEESSINNIEKNTESLRTARKSRSSITTSHSSPSPPAKKKRESTVSRRGSRAKTPLEQPGKATASHPRQRLLKRCGGLSCGPPPCSSSCPRWKGDCANWLNKKLVTDKMLSKECAALGIKVSEKEKKTLSKNLNSFVETMMNNLSDSTKVAYGVFGFQDFVKEAKKLGCFGGEDISSQEVKKQLQSFVKNEEDKKLADGIIWPEEGKDDTTRNFDSA